MKKITKTGKPMGYNYQYEKPEFREKLRKKLSIISNTPEALVNNRKKHLGSNNGRWNGGIYHNPHGYILIKSPLHPFKDIKGYVMEHRLVMEKYIKRFLLPTEVVHHINENRSDNRIENLMLFPNRGYHLQYHKKLSNNQE
jgi:hypothetical protein